MKTVYIWTVYTFKHLHAIVSLDQNKHNRVSLHSDYRMTQLAKAETATSEFTFRYTIWSKQVVIEIVASISRSVGGYRILRGYFSP